MGTTNNQFNLRVANKTVNFVVNQANFNINTWNHYAFVYAAQYGDFYVIINGLNTGITVEGQTFNGQGVNRLSSVPGFLSLNNNYLGTSSNLLTPSIAQGRFEDFRVWKQNRSVMEIFNNKDLRLNERESGLYYNLFLSFKDLSETTPIINGTPLANNSIISLAQKSPLFCYQH